MSNKSESNNQSTEYDPHQNHYFILVDDTEYTCEELINVVRGYYKAIETLRIYADRSLWDADYTDSFCHTEGWEMAQDCLKEIEK